MNGRKDIDENVTIIQKQRATKDYTYTYYPQYYEITHERLLTYLYQCCQQYM